MQIALCIGETTPDPILKAKGITAQKIYRVRNERLCNAIKQGITKHGDRVIHYNSREVKCFPKEDIRLIIGTLDIKQCNDGIHRFVFDKGYDRRKINATEWKHWSIRYMSDWPETRLMFNAPHDRIHTLGTKLHIKRKNQAVITVATSSQKYCDHHNLGNALEYTKSIIQQIKKISNREIWYRPKPSFRGATPIKGTHYNKGKGSSKAMLNKTHVLITDGSHIGAKAVINGIPAITLDGGMGHSVTGHTLDNLEKPYWPDEKKRKNWFADIGYSHFSISEIEKGLAWEVMKQKLQ